MRRLLILPIAIASTAFLQPTSLAQSVTTDPVGFYTVNVPAARIQTVSFSNDNLPDFVGPVSNRPTTSSIATVGASFGTNAFAPFSSNPHIIRVLSGVSEGRQFRIASHTADTLTLTTNGVDIQTAIASGDRYEILPVDTLATLFGQNGGTLATNSNSTLADNIILRNAAGTGYLTYYNNGSNWLRQDTGGTLQNNTPVLPEQGLLLVRRAGTALPITVTGAVPTTRLKTDLPQNRISLIANRFPVDRTLASLGLHAVNGWKSNADSQQADNVILRNSAGTGYLTYYHNGTNWLRTDTGGTLQNNALLRIGAAMLVVRRPGTNITFDEPLPYSLN